MALIIKNPGVGDTTRQALHNLLAGTTGLLQSQWQQVYEYVWKNPFGLSPQDVFDLIGKDAANLLKWLASVATVLNTTVADLSDVPDPIVDNKAATTVEVEVTDGAVRVK